MRSSACLTAGRSAELVVVVTGAATGAKDRAGCVPALASVSVAGCAMPTESGRGRGKGARDVATDATRRGAAAVFLAASFLTADFAAAAAGAFLAAVGFCAEGSCAVSFFAGPFFA